MNEVTKAISAIMLMVAVVCAVGCKKTQVPTVETTQVSNVTKTSAVIGGFVSSDGGSDVVERGVCWGKHANPTNSANVANMGQGIGSFSCVLTDLDPATTYYARAYALNSVGMSYGEQVEFITLDDGGGNETGRHYQISVSATDGGSATGGGSFLEGGTCTVSATAESEYHFDNWTENDSVVSDEPTYTFTVSSDRTLVANFVVNEIYTVSIAANPAEGGVVIGGGSFISGTSHTVTATAYSGYKFLNWTEGGVVVSTNVSYTFIVSTNHSLTANFRASNQVPAGGLNGLFKVSALKQVWFSQGNLQYQASTSTWRFATNQWDYVGYANSNISSSYNGWVDLFGWGTSGWDNGNDCYQPWSTNNIFGHIYGPRVWTTFGYNCDLNLTGAYANSDWGVFNMISNGGNASGSWRTLTNDEWRYVFDFRNTASGIRYAKAIVCGVKGIVLLPDNWDSNAFSLSSTNMMGVDFDSNIINANDWEDSFESFGAVFLPAAGYRYGEEPRLIGSYGCYWSASCVGSEKASEISFDESHLSSQQDSDRYFGESVRLVQDY